MNIVKNFEKNVFDFLVFHHAFQFGCVYIISCKNSSSSSVINCCIIYEMCDCEFMTLKKIYNILNYWQHHWHINLKEKKTSIVVYNFKSCLFKRI